MKRSFSKIVTTSILLLGILGCEKVPLPPSGPTQGSPVPPGGPQNPGLPPDLSEVYDHFKFLKDQNGQSLFTAEEAYSEAQKFVASQSNFAKFQEGYRYFFSLKEVDLPLLLGREVFNESKKFASASVPLNDYKDTYEYFVSARLLPRRKGISITYKILADSRFHLKSFQNRFEEKLQALEPSSRVFLVYRKKAAQEAFDDMGVALKIEELLQGD
jgi:hypothetical protein